MNNIIIPLLLLMITILSATYAMEENTLIQSLEKAQNLVGQAETILDNKQRSLREMVFTTEGKHRFIDEKHMQALNLANQAKFLAEDIQEYDVPEEIKKETKRTLNRITVVETKVNRK